MTSMCLSLDEVDDEYDYRLAAFRPEIRPRRDGYLPLVEAAEEAAKQDALSARVQLVAQNYKTATYKIDQSILVTVPSCGFRDTAIEHWEAKESSYKARAWTAVVLTIANIAALLSPAPYIALVSIITAIYAARQFVRAGEASDQVAEWKVDPAAKLALERKKAYEKGFSYVYNQDLKLGEYSHHAVLLPHEVKYLYDRYSDHTCVKLSAQKCVNNQQKKNWLDCFRTNNPVSYKVLLYVFGKVPQAFSSLSRNFEDIAVLLGDIEAEFSKLRGKRKAETDQVIRNIESQRDLALAIPKAALQYKLNKARAEHDQRLLANRGLHRQIEENYKTDQEKYYALHAAAILPINIYFDEKVKEARRALKDVLGIISRQEANAFSPYYEYSQSIIASITAAKNPHYVYAQQPFNPIQHFQIPELPKIEINFIYQPPAEVDSSFWQH